MVSGANIKKSNAWRRMTKYVTKITQFVEGENL